ncbi:MAG: glycosyl transferase [Candidatus Pacebacteria bacterium]|nr:glycosyl transferase [Candidatus Paceibacterota bacterium]
MITTQFYKGQGLGNQLWCYVVTRSIAKDKGYDFGIQSPEVFKGADFLNLDLGKTVLKNPTFHYQEKELLHPLNGADIRIYDEGLMNVADDTKIDGIMQDERYIAHRKDEIREWLAVKPEADFKDFASDDICIVNFRGSGYVSEKELLLPPSYWRHAMDHMKKIHPRFRFIVITEDPATAKTFFPDLEIHHFNIGKDYAVIKNAHYLILSNSSFAWFPAWLSQNLKYCIAPKYWARHNISDGFWCPGYSLTTGWMYQDRTGALQTYDECQKELKTYTSSHTNIYSGTTTYQPSLKNKIRENVRIFHTLRKESSTFRAVIDIKKMFLRRSYIRLRKLMNGDMLQ